MELSFLPGVQPFTKKVDKEPWAHSYEGHQLTTLVLIARSAQSLKLEIDFSKEL